MLWLHLHLPLEECMNRGKSKMLLTVPCASARQYYHDRKQIHIPAYTPRIYDRDGVGNCNMCSGGDRIMTDEKICPFISGIGPSKDYADLVKVKCQKERCMAWVSECPRLPQVPLRENGLDCEPSDCEDNERDPMECKGGCRLI